jgi:G3E family GTPase
MRLISVSGLNGSGKTALIKTLTERAVTEGRRIAAIVNEEGSERYDQKWCNDHLVAIEYIRGG